ncbi:MAG: amidase family protein [Trebonia sp.]
MTPTVPWVPPLRVWFPSTEEYEAKWRQYGIWEAFTSSWNVTGQPAISLPCRRPAAAGLPVGIQLVGRCGADAPLFTVAAAHEAAADWGGRHPPLGGATAPAGVTDSSYPQPVLNPQLPHV